MRRERATSDFAVSAPTSSASPISSSDRPSSALSFSAVSWRSGSSLIALDDAIELVRLHRARLGVVRDLGRDARVQRQRVALAPGEVQSAPPRDRRQPRADVGGSRPADQRPVGGEQRLLDGVLGQLGTEAPRDVAQQRLPVALHELGERALIARSGAFGEPSIVLVVV